MKKEFNISLFLLYFLLSAGTAVISSVISHEFKMGVLRLSHGYIVAWLFTVLTALTPKKWLRILLNCAALIPISIAFFTDIICILEFHSAFSEDFIGIVLGSDPSESSEFLLLHYKGFLLGLLLLSLFFTAYFLTHKRWTVRLGKPVFITSAVLLLPCLLLININPNARRNLMTFNTTEGEIYLFADYLHNNPRDYKSYVTPADLLVVAGQPDNIVLVFGESHCRNHCSFFGYDKETMPLTQAIMEADTSCLQAFGHVSSPGVNTSDSFKSLMSTYQPEYRDSIPFYTCQTLLQVIRDAGYRSTWISNQSKRGYYDNLIGNFAELSDTAIFVGDKLSGMYRKNYDDELLPLIDTVLSHASAEKNFYVIHFMGSHPAFRDRYPDTFEYFKDEDYLDRPAEQRTFFSTYDNSLRYTDFVFSCIIDRFKDKETVLIYVSDHGLDFFVSRPDYCAHSVANDESVSAIESRAVPFLVYTSDLYRQHFPTESERIRRSTGHEYRTDSLIYTVMDLAGVAFRDSTLNHGSILLP